MQRRRGYPNKIRTDIVAPVIVQASPSWDSSAVLLSDLRKIASHVAACSDPHGNRIERRPI
jgi:hypothetical protein